MTGAAAGPQCASRKSGWMAGGGMLMAVLSRNDAVKPCDLPPSWAVAAGAIEAWIVSAEPGDDIVYASGSSLPPGMASVYLVRALAEARQVRMQLRPKRDTRQLASDAARCLAESPMVPIPHHPRDPRGRDRRRKKFL